MTTSSFWNFISSVENEYNKYRKQITEKYRLSAAEADILMYDTAADISKIRRILKSQVSVSVKSLCEKGLLAGSYKNGNRKSIHLAITEKAKPIITFGKKIQNEFSSLLFTDFSEEEKEAFDKLHRKIELNINKKERK